MFDFHRVVSSATENTWVIGLSSDFPDPERFAKRDPTVPDTIPGVISVGIMTVGGRDHLNARKRLAVAGNLTPHERQILFQEADAVIEASFKDAAVAKGTPTDRHADLLDRLRASNAPGLARALERIARGEASVLLVAEGLSVTDDPALDAEVEEFLHAHGAELIRVPKDDEVGLSA